MASMQFSYEHLRATLGRVVTLKRRPGAGQQKQIPP